jgi:hypothetical protein
MDILAVREATKWCADYIRSGKVKYSKFMIFEGSIMHSLSLRVP